jgi:hypothetical protein
VGSTPTTPTTKEPVMMITYGDLYDYLEEVVKQTEEDLTDYSYVIGFCTKYNIESKRLLQILYDFGGHSDIEVILNLPKFIRYDTPITKDVETPVEYAIRNNLYARFHEGMWVRCKKNDNGSIPDLNTAYQQMFPNK